MENKYTQGARAALPRVRRFVDATMRNLMRNSPRLILFAVAACSKDSSPAGPGTSVDHVQVTPSQVNISVGSTFQWGANYSRQLGDGTSTDRYVPTVVAGGITW